MSPLGLFSLSVAALSYGAMFVIDKAVVNKGVDPAAYSVSRVFIAMLILAAIVKLRRRESLFSVFRRDRLRDLVIIGLLASGIGLFLQIKGLSLSSATNVSLLLTLVAPLTSVFAWLLLKEQITQRFLLASALMLLGVWSVYVGNTYAPFGLGDVLLIVAMIGFAFSNVHARKTMKNIPTLVVTYGRLVFGSLSLALCLPFLSASFLSLGNTPGLIILGGAAFGLRMVSYYKGIELEGASVAATFLLASPIVAVLSANIFLNEPLTLQIGYGMALVVAGGFLLSTARNPG